MKLWLVFLFSWIANVLIYSVPALAQDERLIAMVHIVVDGAVERRGAAIIVGIDDDEVTLATAAHTVDQLYLENGDRIEVEFLAALNERHIATIASEWPSHDLAALTVHLTANSLTEEEFSEARTALLPDGISAEIADPLFSIGFPGSRPWFGNRRADVLRDFKDSDIVYESTVTVPGMSGGGLFGDHGALLGMVKDVSGTQARALDIDVVRDLFVEIGLNFDLVVDPAAVASLLHAERNRHISGADSLATSLSTNLPLFPRLHLAWASGGRFDGFADALGRRVTGSEQSVYEFLLERMQAGSCTLSELEGTRAEVALSLVLQDAGLEANADCTSHYRLWLDGALSAGLNPDLVVTSRTGIARSLLSIALRAGSTDAVLSLLEAGASPNPYEDLQGKSGRYSTMTHPFYFIAENFEGRDFDRVWQAFIDAGTFVFEAPDRSGTLSVPEDFKSIQEVSTKTVCTRLTRNSGIELCDVSEAMPPNFSFRAPEEVLRDSVTRMSHGEVGPVVAVSGQDLFFAGRALSYTGKSYVPIVIRVDAQSGRWGAFVFSDSFGCRVHSDGYEPRRCWRDWYAFAPAAVPFSEVPSMLADDPVAAGFSVRGVGPQTSVADALKILKAQEFSARFVWPSTDYERLLLALPLKSTKGNDEVTLFVLDNRIVGIGVRGDSGVQNLEGLDALVQLDGVAGGYYRQSGFRGRVIHARHNSSQGAWSIALMQTKEGERQLFAYQRAARETPSETSFWTHHEDEWLGKQSETKEDLPCSDKNRHVRLKAAVNCPTPSETSTDIMRNFREMEGTEVLKEGVLYRYLHRGSGEKISLSEEVSLSFTERKWGLQKIVGSENGLSILVGDENYKYWIENFLHDLLPRLRRGDEVSVLLAPETWNSYFDEGARTPRNLPFVYKLDIYGPK